ncbi:MAG: hypothetical protein H7337_14140 [Rhizobacter sp.]|nr:hypothetical protein [Rhizobacter sp.]
MKSELSKLRVCLMLQRLALTATFATCTVQPIMAGDTKVFEWRDANGGDDVFAEPAATGNPRGNQP